jgi:HD-GYP domain-containing protein (c-di-GMP phosphodiesterase class II)
MTGEEYLFIAPGVPDFFDGTENIGAVTIERGDHLPSRKNRDISYGYLLDTGFIRKNRSSVKEKCDPGTVILWNPDGDDIYKSLPSELVFQELSTFTTKTMFRLTVRNLFKRLALEGQVAEQAESIETKERITKELLDIGVALSAERDNDALLDTILQKSREITRADAGSLYLLEKDEETGSQSLLFKIAHNDSNPTDFTEFRMPLNTKSIAGYVAVTGEPLNIKDAYRIPKKKKVTFNKHYDETTGYRTKSILTVPMKDHKERIIGVVQLINRKSDFSIVLEDKQTVHQLVEPFDRENEAIVLSLSSQAAVSLENNRLYNEIETLFEGFVRAASKAIESRDPTTSGHSNRVAAYTVELARAVHRRREGKYKDYTVNDDQIKQIRYAGLLHDFGKVGVRENVLVKARKLYEFQLDLVDIRFNYIMKAQQTSILKKRFEYLKNYGSAAYNKKKQQFDREEKEAVNKLKEYMKVIREANEPRLLEEDPSETIEKIAEQEYQDMFGNSQNYLTDEERTMLTIKRGSLSNAEREEIKSHVIHSYEFLKKIPWTAALTAIPDIARRHHEKIDGRGYPDGVTEEKISIESRMMAIADIYDALTAQDRPYKKAVSDERALEILREEAESGSLDPELVEIFIDENVYEKAGDA